MMTLTGVTEDAVTTTTMAVETMITAAVVLPVTGARSCVGVSRALAVAMTVAPGMTKEGSVTARMVAAMLRRQSRCCSLQCRKRVWS
jgi:hypothetical protein